MKCLYLVFKAFGYSCFNLDTIMKKEAVRYANQCYNMAFNSGSPKMVQQYKSWLSRILYYQKTVPQATYFPQDMYDHIVARLGLYLMPVSEENLEKILHHMRTVVRKQIASVLSTIPSAGSIHFCYRKPVSGGHPFRQHIVRSAAYFCEVPTGYLLLHSDGRLKDYDFADSQLIENRILYKKLRGIYLPVLFNN